ncbi:hypothetical protein BH10BAC2_BH10BAC2_40790 [soil metagenome]
MKKCPVPVIIVAILFILTGCMGFVYHFKDLANAGISVYESTWVLFLRILAIVCGTLLLYRIKWARWLAIAWLAYHVVIGAFHSTEQMITHMVFLALVTILLFLPVSSAYFNKQKPY